MLADRNSLFFHDLAFHADGDEVAVGRPETGSFAIFPADGAELLRRLMEGSTPASAATWYQGTYGEAVDMDQFLASLHELGLVRTSAGAPSPSPPLAEDPVRWQRLGRAVFSVPARLVWLGVLVTAVLGCVRNPQLVPARHDVFFVRSLLVIELTIVVAQIPLTLVHELAHVLAGRRVGVWSRLRVGHRFTVVVFETVLDGLVVVPRSKRYLPLAAGMLADLAVMAGLVDAAWLLRTWQHRVSVAALICLALAYTTIPRIAWQFFVFLRTDGYFLLQTALGGDDIDAAARDQLRAWWSRRLRRPAPAAPVGRPRRFAGRAGSAGPRRAGGADIRAAPGRRLRVCRRDDGGGRRSADVPLHPAGHQGPVGRRPAALGRGRRPPAQPGRTGRGEAARPARSPSFAL